MLHASRHVETLRTWSSPRNTVASKMGAVGTVKSAATMLGPDSASSPFGIHICRSGQRKGKEDPPVRTEYFCPGEPTTVVAVAHEAKAVTSSMLRTPILRKTVVSPDGTTFAQKAVRISTWHLTMRRRHSAGIAPRRGAHTSSQSLTTSSTHSHCYTSTEAYQTSWLCPHPHASRSFC